VPENKILEYDDRIIRNARYLRYGRQVPDNGKNVLSLAFFSRFGFGDSLLASVLIKEIRKTIRSNLLIDFYTGSVQLFDGLPFVDNVYKYEHKNVQKYINEENYDAVFDVMNYCLIPKISLEKIKRFSKVLYDFSENELYMFNSTYRKETSPFLHYDYSEIKRNKQIEALDSKGILPLNRNTPTYMQWSMDAFDSAKTLVPEKYITISNCIENVLPLNHPKVWPPKYYNKLVSMIKTKFPQIAIVVIGENFRFGKINDADIDLIGKTSVDELKFILKNSLLHIGPEGGLVHMKHFLNGKSVVIFGSSSVTFSGYDGNYNLRSNLPCCNGSCFLYKINYVKLSCPFSREKDYAKCMETLQPEAVFCKVIEHFENVRIYSSSKEEISEIDESLFCISDNVALINRKNSDTVLKYSNRVNSLVVYDTSLSDGDNLHNASINCNYIDELSNYNALAEYGFIYNIPAPDGHYDKVFNFTIADERHSDEAVKELFRITKPGGSIILMENARTIKITKSTASRRVFYNG